jgi:prevent-host-death family protein
MERVSVADLKSRLSHYLREVRAGRSFVVTSRDIPVATLVPYDIDDFDDLESIPADPNAEPIDAPVLGAPPPGLPDAVDLLRRDRDDRDERLLQIALEAIEARRRREAGGDPS